MDAYKKLIVGLFVGATLLLFGVGLFLIGDAKQLFSKSFDVSADFEKVTGLEIGTKVRVAGMDAGAVTVITIPPQPNAKFKVRFRIAEKLHPLVRRDSVASIQTDGLLGNKFLEIGAGTNGSPIAKDGSGIRGEEPFDWGNLMDQVKLTVKAANDVVVGLKEPLHDAINNIAQTAHSTDLMIRTATPRVRSILDSSSKVAANIKEIADGIREGRGAIGALIYDEQLSGNVKHAVADARQAVQHLRDTTESVKNVVSKVDDSEIVPEVQQAVKNMREITAQVKDAVEKFQSATAEGGGVGENLQRTLASANEAMSDLADDTEALKHNFFFRGFFKKRGFYDLGGISAPEYQAGKVVGKGFTRHPIWLEGSALFTVDAKGVEGISVAGKVAIDEAMAVILQLPRNGPMMVEGYATAGTPSEQFLRARRRAALVRTYLIYRFHLRPNYTGTVAMGAAPVDGAAGEGVRLVSFYKK